MLQGKRIILGICGSIAAYKAAFLVRLLIKSGAEVQVVMTAGAEEFITPLTLATLSKKPILTDMVADAKQGTWNNHVKLGMWADLLVVAPASAHTLSKLANGICNDLLTAIYLSARCPVILAPAMDLDMYKHPSTTKNLERLRSYNNIIVDAESGELASGLDGQGRLAEPEHIVAKLESFFKSDLPLSGKKILLTAGSTQEAIDPVRYITNASSGKMGYALAEALLTQGAEVVLVSGPSQLKLAHERLKLIRVVSARQMYDEAAKNFSDSDVAIFTAAVSDYRPKHVHDQKIKKDNDAETLNLVKNIDIARTLSLKKKPHQYTVGFALETNDEEHNAIRKINEKNLDMIILNSLNDPGAGFGYDTNQIKIFFADKDDSIQSALKSKHEIATDIVALLIEKLNV